MHLHSASPIHAVVLSQCAFPIENTFEPVLTITQLTAFSSTQARSYNYFVIWRLF